MKIEELKNDGLLLFECISGSRAYGLNTPTSDTDIKGVFVVPKEVLFGLMYTEQINNETNDIVYYELKKFVDLLSKNNPNLLEMLASPAECILYKHPLFDHFRIEDILSKECKNSFAGYAITQIQKAKGLNKKIVNPVKKERKSILDFCFVVHKQGSLPLLDFLRINNMKMEKCGLSRIPHMHELYGLYYRYSEDFKGIIQKESANEVSLSSIPEEMEPKAIMSFNKSGYSTYCKEYKEYWEWVEKRNDERYSNTLSHGKNYDAKNMMHTFRLLDMAAEIGESGQIIVRRPNREFLLRIRAGEFEYEDLVKMANDKIEKMDEIYAHSALPDKPNLSELNSILIEIRTKFYEIHC